MISAEIRLNGKIVGVVNVQNLGPPDGLYAHEQSLFQYRADYFNHTTQEWRSALFSHDRRESFDVLFAKAFAKLRRASQDPTPGETGEMK